MRTGREKKFRRASLRMVGKWSKFDRVRKRPKQLLLCTHTLRFHIRTQNISNNIKTLREYTEIFSLQTEIIN